MSLLGGGEGRGEGDYLTKYFKGATSRYSELFFATCKYSLQREGNHKIFVC